MDLSDSLTTSTEGGFVSARVTRWSAVDQVITQLREAILSGRMPVGSMLPSEAKLSASMGVSRPVVREALGSLRALGLVASRTGKGWEVTNDAVGGSLVLANAYMSEHLYEVRRHLEIPSAGEAALRRREADVQALREVLDAERDAGDPTSAVALDGRFHIGIARCTGNPLMVSLVEYIRSGLEEQSRALTTVHGRGAQALREHWAILDAIAAGDRRAAEAAMRAHLTAVQRTVAVLGAPPPAADTADTADTAETTEGGAA